MSKKAKDNSIPKPSDKLLQASYKAGLASGRLEAIEESIDAIAALIIKAEALQGGFNDNTSPATCENARHTLQALYVAFAAVSGSINGSAAFQALLAQSKQRLTQSAAIVH